MFIVSKKHYKFLDMNLKKSRILVIDDDKDVLTALNLLLKKQVAEVVTEKNPELVITLLQKSSYDLILLDMNFNASINTGNEGIYWLNKIRTQFPAQCVVMITAYADIDLAVRSLKEGASDFIVKPWNNQHLLDSIEEILKKKGKPEIEEVIKDVHDSGIIGKSAKMQDIFSKIDKVAPTDAN